MASPHYVRVDVPSDYCGEWMTYYTRHSKMAAPHYVWADASSEYSVHLMT
jgi:hypothetical protein